LVVVSFMVFNATFKYFSYIVAVSFICDKPDDFTFSIVNFPFISNIPASPVYRVYILQLIRYSRICGQYSDFQLLRQNLLKQGYVAPKLRSSLQNFYGRHLEISISQMTMDLLLFT